MKHSCGCEEVGNQRLSCLHHHKLKSLTLPRSYSSATDTPLIVSVFVLESWEEAQVDAEANPELATVKITARIVKLGGACTI